MRAYTYFMLVFLSLVSSPVFAECKNVGLIEFVRSLDDYRVKNPDIPKIISEPQYSLQINDRCYALLEERPATKVAPKKKYGDISYVFYFNGKGKLMHWQEKSLHGSTTNCKEGDKLGFIKKSKEVQLQVFKEKIANESAFKESKKYETRRYNALVFGCVVNIVEFLSDKGSNSEFYRIWELDREGEIINVGKLVSKPKVKTLSAEEERKRREKLDGIKMRHTVEQTR